MLTLQDIINELMRIREAVNSLEVKGNQNASIVCYIYSRCDDLIDTLNKTIEEIQKQNQNGSENRGDSIPEPEFTLTEDGEEIVQQDRDST